jgi:hypothetical protein
MAHIRGGVCSYHHPCLSFCLALFFKCAVQGNRKSISLRCPPTRSRLVGQFVPRLCDFGERLIVSLTKSLLFGAPWCCVGERDTGQTVLNDIQKPSTEWCVQAQVTALMDKRYAI